MTSDVQDRIIDAVLSANAELEAQVESLMKQRKRSDRAFVKLSILAGILGMAMILGWWMFFISQGASILDSLRSNTRLPGVILGEVTTYGAVSSKTPLHGAAPLFSGHMNFSRATGQRPLDGLSDIHSSRGWGSQSEPALETALTTPGWQISGEVVILRRRVQFPGRHA